MTFSQSIPLFPVKDVESTVNYYKSVLGFEVDFELGNPVNYAAVSRGAITIHIAKQAQPYSPALRQRAILIVVDDVEGIYNELKANGADIIQPLMKREYGYRDFDVIDNNGFILSFGTAISN